MRRRPQISQFFLFLILISAIIPLSNSQSTEILVSPSSLIISVLDYFSIDINLVNSPLFVAFEVNLAYDPVLLNVSNVVFNIPWSNVGYTHNEDEGTLYIHGFNWESGLSGNLSFATVTFHAEAMGNTPLHLYDTKLYDESVTEIPHTTSDGNVEVLGMLNLNAETNKQIYSIYESVSIYGNVSMEGISINNSLIAIQVDAQQRPLLYRTVTTGEVPTELPAEILSITPCDNMGNPKSSFNAGSYAYFDVTIRNNLATTLNILQTVTLFDCTGAPIREQGHEPPLIMGPLIGGSIGEWRAEIPIPSNTPAGIAKAYTCAFSDFPRSNGTAYCPEKSATFQIISGKTTTLPLVQQGEAPLGSFNYTFRLGLYGGLGVYNASVTSVYKIKSDATKMNFTVSLLGDFNGDGKVGPSDFFRFARAYGSKLGEPAYFPEADFNQNEKIDPSDFYVFARNYGISV